MFVTAVREHTCINCATRFEYELRRDVPKGENPQHVMENEFSEYPCPSCGFIQPEMTKGTRSDKHFLTLVASALPIAILIVMAILEKISMSSTIICAFFIAVIVGFIHIKMIFHDPKAEMETNKSKAQRLVDKGKLKIHQKKKKVSLILQEI